MLKWGRTLARHGALRGIEEDPLTPPQVRRLARIARFGARSPPAPDYAEALQEIGPAAIKLGQALSTRPDLVGERAAENLSQLQDDLPPAPFAAIKRTIETSFGAPLEALFSRFDEVPVGAASIAQVHRAVTTDGRDVAVKVLRPGIEEEFAKAIETYEWAAAHVERYGGEAERLRPRLVVAHFRVSGRPASSTSSARRHRRRSCAKIWSPSRAITCPRSTGGGPRGASSPSNGSTASSSTTATR